MVTSFLGFSLTALCWLRGCKNWRTPFPGRMSYKASKPGLVSVLYLSMHATPYLAETLHQSTNVDACRRLWSAATSTLINEMRHTWRPHLPGSGCTRLEQLAVFYPGCVIIAAVLSGTEDSAVFTVIWHSRLTAETAFPFLSFFHC